MKAAFEKLRQPVSVFLSFIPDSPPLPSPACPHPRLVSLLTCFISAAESRSESPVRFNHSPARGASSCCGKAGRTWREVKRISTRTFFGGGSEEGVCDYTDLMS